MQLSTFAGIDISKDTFDVALERSSGTPLIRKFHNHHKGFEKFKRWLEHLALSMGHLHLAMEATGGYERPLARWLFATGATVSILNPLAVQGFAQSKLKRNKTDSADARTILDFLKTRRPPPWVPPTETMRQFAGLQRRVKQLRKDLQRERNRLKAPDIIKEESDSIKSTIQCLNKEINRIELMLQGMINNDEKMSRQNELLKTIPGVGPSIARGFLLVVGDIKKFKSARAVAAFLGVCPRLHQSGTSVWEKPRMSKMGSKELRSKLWMGAQVSKTCNPLVKSFVEGIELRNPGKSKRALTGAAMHKLVKIMYGVLKSNKPFDPKWRSRKKMSKPVALG